MRDPQTRQFATVCDGDDAADHGAGRVSIAEPGHRCPERLFDGIQMTIRHQTANGTVSSASTRSPNRGWQPPAWASHRGSSAHARGHVVQARPAPSRPHALGDRPIDARRSSWPRTQSRRRRRSRRQWRQDERVSAQRRRTSGLDGQVGRAAKIGTNRRAPHGRSDFPRAVLVCGSVRAGPMHPPGDRSEDLMSAPTVSACRLGHIASGERGSKAIGVDGAVSEQVVDDRYGHGRIVGPAPLAGRDFTAGNQARPPSHRQRRTALRKHHPARGP